MGVFFSKYIVKKNLEFLKGGRGRRRGSFFIILKYLKQLLSKPCAILYLLKDRVANPPP